MAANTITQLTTANTFQHWLTATQSLIGVANNLTNGAGDTFYANTRLEVGGTGASLNVVTSATIQELFVSGNTTIGGTLNVSSLSGSGTFGSLEVADEFTFNTATGNTITVADEFTFNTATGNTLTIVDIDFSGNLTGNVTVANTNIEGVITTDQIANGAITAEKLASGAALPSTSGNATYFLTTDGTEAIWKAQSALGLASTNVTVTSFSTTANGLVSSFDLDFQPINEESLIVSLDGILQQPTSAYTVSGNTITFSSSPSDTVNVVVTSMYTNVATYSVEVAAGVQTTAENAYDHANGAFDLANTALTATSTSSNVQFNSFGVGTAASTTTGEIRATNQITAYYSDKRLKNIKGNIDNALDKVMSLNGVYYENNEVAEKYGYLNTEQHVGVLAQEVEQVLPEIVKPAPFDIGQNEDGTEYSLSGHHYKTVQYEKMVPLLLEAIKELKIELDKLKAK